MDQNDQPVKPEKDDKPEKSRKPERLDKPAGFCVKITAPDGATCEWAEIGAYMVVGFHAPTGRLEMLDTSGMSHEAMLFALHLVQQTLQPVVLATLGDYARREARRKPRIVAASAGPMSV